ncbi:MAG: hypothetical protein MJ245_00520 [Clostridia bacterium]|nr:hypothetical protein [Clostridia bacterium]
MKLITGVLINRYAQIIEFEDDFDSYENLLDDHNIELYKIQIQDEKILTAVCVSQELCQDEDIMVRAVNSVGEDLLYGKLILVNLDENHKATPLTDGEINAIESSLTNYVETMEDGSEIIDERLNILVCEFVE